MRTLQHTSRNAAQRCAISDGAQAAHLPGTPQARRVPAFASQTRWVGSRGQAIGGLVLIQSRFRVMSYSSRYEASNLCTYALKPRAQTA